MYEGFSGQARKAVQLARDEAVRLRHDHLGTEHLVLGVLREGSQGVVKLLAAFGTDPEKAYRQVKAQPSQGSGGVSWDRLPRDPDRPVPRRLPGGLAQGPRTSGQRLNVSPSFPLDRQRPLRAFHQLPALPCLLD
jgi:hypothetical protein